MNWTHCTRKGHRDLWPSQVTGQRQSRSWGLSRKSPDFHVHRLWRHEIQKLLYLVSLPGGTQLHLFLCCCIMNKLLQGCKGNPANIKIWPVWLGWVCVGGQAGHPWAHQSHPLRWGFSSSSAVSGVGTVTTRVTSEQTEKFPNTWDIIG